jgi:hypothetical protein
MQAKRQWVPCAIELPTAISGTSLSLTTDVIAAVHQIILFFVNARYTLLLTMERGERGYV